MKFRLGKAKTRSVKKADDIQGFAWHTCKNCAYHFEGKYCPSCGQNVREIQQPILHFLEDMFGSLFAMDMRLLNSLPLLLVKPGKLSQEFIEGKRNKHIAPFRFYLFASLIFFFLIGFQTKKLINEEEITSSGEVMVVDSIKQKLEVQKVINDQDTVFAISSLKEGLGFMSLLEKSLEEKLSDSTITSRERQEATNVLNAYQDPNVIVSKVYQYISWSFFVLMPWFAIVLFAFFFRKRKYYVEHLVFSVNLHTFYFLILIIVLLIGMLFPGSLEKMGGWIFLLMVIYTILGIKNFYKKKWYSAVAWSLLLFFIYATSIIALISATLFIVYQANFT